MIILVFVTFDIESIKWARQLFCVKIFSLYIHNSRQTIGSITFINMGHFKAAYILLNCDQGEYSEKVTNEEICKNLKVGMRTIDRVKKKMVEEKVAQIKAEEDERTIH